MAKLIANLSEQGCDISVGVLASVNHFQSSREAGSSWVVGPLHAPDKFLERMRIFETRESKLVVLLVGTGSVNIDSVQSIGDNTTSVASRFHNVTVCDLIERDLFMEREGSA